MYKSISWYWMKKMLNTYLEICLLLSHQQHLVVPWGCLNKRWIKTQWHQYINNAHLLICLTTVPSLISLSIYTANITTNGFWVIARMLNYIRSVYISLYGKKTKSSMSNISHINFWLFWPSEPIQYIWCIYFHTNSSMNPGSPHLSPFAPACPVCITLSTNGPLMSSPRSKLFIHKNIVIVIHMNRV